MSAEATMAQQGGMPNNAYHPPTTPGTTTGFYPEGGVQTHYTGQRSELGDR
jgi:hypothetical protein